ncbi:hypothetical protein BD324DRAFT_355284 [Kockovaella imperatae]|uniref:Uncharacterized protein n=1 Tax=Kockovaella imperatae TaxID=4999 RepID=A0A1Y1ULJ4_9TREE|nr:hypothetical protein BD324DRAFT_355284 [Kockovaella imperatae]ORX38417.1 hypothetical protein BD324DRAFT_355284 [Kockovaella imperatae]
MGALLVLPIAHSKDGASPSFLGELSLDDREVQLQRRIRALEKRLGETLLDDGRGGLMIQPRPGDPKRSSSSLPPGAGSNDVDRRHNGSPFNHGALPLTPRRSKQSEVTNTSRVELVTDHDCAQEDDIIARNRRRQLVKLQKLLGEIVTPAYLPPGQSSTETPPETPVRQSLSRQTIRRVDSPMSDKTSFIDMSADDLSHPIIQDGTTPLKDGPGSGTLLKGPWATRFKQSISMSSSKPKGKAVHGDDESFVNFGHKAGVTWGKLNPLNVNSPVPQRSRAEETSIRPKISAPMLQTPEPSSLSPSIVAGTFNQYKQSLQGLLFLAENNPSRLARMVDSLDHDLPSVPSPRDPWAPKRPPRPDRGSPSPPSPIIHSPTLPPPESSEEDAVRINRKRSEKLTNFFGEGLDFTDPNISRRRLAARYDDAPAVVTHRTGVARNPSGKNRFDLLDGMLGDMWRGVQNDYKVGEMKRDEVDRLGDMMNAFRRKRESMTGWEEL